jgi:hypothetical protein
MAIEAPAHREGLALCRERHRPDFPMTGRATNSLVHVNAVVEIHVIGQAGDPVPRQGQALRRALDHRPQRRRIRGDLRMAGQADLCARHSRECLRLHGCMAVAAIDVQLAGVEAVAKADGLPGSESDTAPMIGVKVGSGHESGGGDEEACAGDSHSKKNRGPRRKKRTARLRGITATIRLGGRGNQSHCGVPFSSYSLFCRGDG